MQAFRIVSHEASYLVTIAIPKGHANRFLYFNFDHPIISDKLRPTQLMWLFNDMRTLQNPNLTSLPFLYAIGQ